MQTAQYMESTLLCIRPIKVLLKGFINKVFSKEGALFISFITQSNDSKFTTKFSAVVAERMLIQIFEQNLAVD